MSQQAGLLHGPCLSRLPWADFLFPTQVAFGVLSQEQKKKKKTKLEHIPRLKLFGVGRRWEKKEHPVG
jgi:hypothetical protein